MDISFQTQAQKKNQKRSLKREEKRKIVEVKKFQEAFFICDPILLVRSLNSEKKEEKEEKFYTFLLGKEAKNWDFVLSFFDQVGVGHFLSIFGSNCSNPVNIVKLLIYQNELFAETTEKTLLKLGIDQCAIPVDKPLSEIPIFGRE